jgi:outer membrane protein OmpA-like peptidoglycan-associated protein
MRGLAWWPDLHLLTTRLVEPVAEADYCPAANEGRLGLRRMRILRVAIAPLTVISLAFSCAGVLAQSTPANPDVVSAPAAPGNGVLLYPGGEYGRVIHPLLQPGDPYPGSQAAPLHLHMPKKHVARKVAPPPAPTDVAALDSTQQAPAPLPTQTAASDTLAPVSTSPSPPPPPPAPPKFHQLAKPAKTRVASTPPAPVAASPDASSTFGASAVPFSFGSSATPEAAPSPPPARVAKASPPPAQTFATDTSAPLPSGLSKQTQILFAPGAPDPSPDAIDAIKGLAGPLNSALVAGTSRIQIVAYGGARGDKSSDARRLSLKRGRIIRQLLIDGGVPSERIDVRAMGGATDGAATDRVDIFTKA